MYKLTPLQFGQTAPNCVIRTIDNVCIPFDPANTDYAAYLKWVEAGNTPLSADEVTK